LAVVNEGNAMDLTSGIFTAPRPGIYFFTFTGAARFPESSSTVSLEIGLYLNGVLIGSNWVLDANTINGQKSTSTLQSTLKLKSGDQVWVAIFYYSTGVYLDEYTGEHLTHFTGWLLEEDIVASL
jgi:hypothetical protein